MALPDHTATLFVVLGGICKLFSLVAAPAYIPVLNHVCSWFQGLRPLPTSAKRCCHCWLVSKSCLTLQPHVLWPATPLCLRDFPGRDTGADCHLFLQGIFQPRDRTQVSHIAGRFFTSWATREAQVLGIINRLEVGGSWKGGKALLQVQRVHGNLSTIVCSDVPMLSLRELLSQQGKGNLLRLRVPHLLQV